MVVSRHVSSLALSSVDEEGVSRRGQPTSVGALALLRSALYRGGLLLVGAHRDAPLVWKDLSNPFLAGCAALCLGVVATQCLSGRDHYPSIVEREGETVRCLTTAHHPGIRVLGGCLNA